MNGATWYRETCDRDNSDAISGQSGPHKFKSENKRSIYENSLTRFLASIRLIGEREDFRAESSSNHPFAVGLPAEISGRSGNYEAPGHARRATALLSGSLTGLGHEGESG